MICHASHDENGYYYGGKAGDQTGTEICIREWYNRPWNVILRPATRKIAWLIADAMEKAAKNENIGYDQNQRESLYNEAEKVGFDISKITTPCECDCSSLIAVVCKTAGVEIGKDSYTGNLRKRLLSTGKFYEIIAKNYLNSPHYLLRGDILLYEGHHAAVNLTDGPAARLYGIGWHIDSKGWWYANSATTYHHDTWAIIDFYKFYFDSDGYAVTGLQEIDGEMYYFKEKKKNGTYSRLECALCFTDEQGRLTPKKFY